MTAMQQRKCSGLQLAAQHRVVSMCLFAGMPASWGQLTELCALRRMHFVNHGLTLELNMIVCHSALP